MAHLHPPECLTGWVNARESDELLGGDAKDAELGGIVWKPVTVRVQFRAAVADREDLDDPAVFRGHPDRPVAVVVAHGYGTAHGEPQEVGDVERHGSVKEDIFAVELEGRPSAFSSTA